MNFDREDLVRSAFCFFSLFIFFIFGHNSASGFQSQTSLTGVFSAAVDAIGSKDAIARLRNIKAKANCIGPDGNYKTPVTSFRSNKTIFLQTFSYKSDRKTIYINEKFGWSPSENDEIPKIVSPFEKLVVRLHEYQKMSFDFRSMFSDFALVGNAVFEGRKSTKVRAKTDLDGSIFLYFDIQNKTLSGFEFRPNGSDQIIKNVFGGWKTFGELKLPTRITATDSRGEWILNFENITLNSADENLLKVPQMVSDLEALMRLHQQHIDAHLNYDAELFLETFADQFTQIQGGDVSVNSRKEIHERFKNYFASFKFHEWEDIKPPVYKISKDGTLATVTVEKRVRGTYKNDRGEEESDNTIFAWLEVWEKLDGKWKIITVASTSKNQ
ncbi:MAG: nuclear transport factor 2 family protein [Acidobacteria bacterium]|nr:nuclear transport factor 2 family protein [Acidobacteriota bacterium]